MNINETKTVLSYIFQANPDQAVFLWGAPGVGKSQLVQQVCADMGRNLVDIRLSQMDSVDLKGIPSVMDGMTCFNEPVELPRKTDDFLFLDEANAAPRAVQAAAMQLVLDRCLGSYKIPAGVPVLAAGNRTSDGAVANRMPSALNNRFIHLTVDPDLKTMVSYALDKGWPMELIQFLRFRPNMLHDMPKTLIDGAGFPSPRSWNMVVTSRALDIQDQATRRFLLTGAVGSGAMVELEGFIRTFRSLPNLDAIMANPHSEPLPTESSAKYAVAGALARKADATTISSVMVYLQRFPEQEYVAMAVNDMLKLKKELSSSAALVGWLAQHRAA